MHGPDDLLTGLASGCESAINIMTSRVCFPVGLDLGLDKPESIALAIATEIKDYVRGRERLERLSQQHASSHRLASEALPGPVSS